MANVGQGCSLDNFLKKFQTTFLEELGSTMKLTNNGKYVLQYKYYRSKRVSYFLQIFLKFSNFLFLIAICLWLLKENFSLLINAFKDNCMFSLFDEKIYCFISIMICKLTLVAVLLILNMNDSSLYWRFMWFSRNNVLRCCKNI